MTMNKMRAFVRTAAVLFTWAALSTSTGATCYNNAHCEENMGGDECDILPSGGEHCHWGGSGTECHGGSGSCEGGVEG
jgi:hypothetical protein